MSHRRERARPVLLESSERLWSTQEVSDFLGVPVTTLHQWRYLGTGPEAFKVGRHLRYEPLEVRRWLYEECRQDRSA
jgi:predicted DNA-binding transcriptional regulator AlpA